MLGFQHCPLSKNISQTGCQPALQEVNSWQHLFSFKSVVERYRSVAQWSVSLSSQTVLANSPLFLSLAKTLDRGEMGLEGQVAIYKRGHPTCKAFWAVGAGDLLGLSLVPVPVNTPALSMSSQTE